MEQWLVRTQQNVIMGPYSREEVREMIQEGSLGLQDEVCQANHYWIYLHEREELIKQLGMEPPAYQVSDEDVTLTQTETETQLAVTAQEFKDFTDAPEETGVFTRSSAQSGRPQIPLNIPKLEKVFVIGQLEKVSFWRGVAWALVVLTVILAAVVIALLRDYRP
jgi:hypothetical protein